jgi:hypothetical protein
MRAFLMPSDLIRKLLFLSALILALFALTLSLSALRVDDAKGASLTSDAQNVCTSLNCGSTAIRAQTLASGPGALPFTTQVLAGAGECLRIDATAQTTDTELVLVSPDGTLWRNDDTTGLLPEIRADPTPVAGWYEVHLNHFAGSAVDATATIRYGRYNSGNVNCRSPSQPFSSSSSASSK